MQRLQIVQFCIHLDSDDSGLGVEARKRRFCLLFKSKEDRFCNVTQDAADTIPLMCLPLLQLLVAQIVRIVPHQQQRPYNNKMPAVYSETLRFICAVA